MATRTSVIITSDANPTKPSWNDAEIQQFVRDFLSSPGGVLDTGTNLQVTELPIPTNQVRVAAGECYIEIVKNSRTYKVRLENDANVDLAIAANSSGDPRKDRIIAKIDVATEPDANAANIGTIEVVQGTPDPSPSAPATPANAISLAIVDVANGQTVFENADVTDDRTICTIPKRFIETIEISGVNGLQTALDGKEASFSKNSGFNLDKASQSEAEAGTLDTKVMTPLRVKQAIAQNASGGKVVTGSFSVNYNSGSAQSGSHAKTGIGFQPESVIFRAWITTNNAKSEGISDGANQNAIYFSDSLTNPGIDTAKAMYLDTNIGSSADVDADISMDSDGFTVDWDIPATGGVTGSTTVNYIAICS